MDALHIIESIYSGKSYKETLDVALKANYSPFDFKITRVPPKHNIIKSNIEFEPYKLDMETYSRMLEKLNLNIFNVIPISLGLFSRPEDFDLCISEFFNGKGTITEPLKLEDLLFSDKSSNSYLSPLGLLAILFRKSYGNEEFKVFVNSTFLKEYLKTKVNGKTCYVRNESDVKFVEELQKYFVGENNWQKVSNTLIQSPFVYIWRD